MSATKATQKSGKRNAVWTAEEQAAMKEIAKERKAEARWAKDKAEGESAALAAIAAMKEPDRSMAKRIHTIIKDNAPALLAKTWYGMPAYANKEGNVLCFFQPAQKFKARYSTLGFNDAAKLDEGDMWPVAFALRKLSAADAARIAALVKKAVK